MPGHNQGRATRRHASLLRQSAEHLEIFRQFVESAGQPLGMADLEGRVFFVNSILCRMLGEASPEDAYRQDLFAYYTPETVKRLREEILPLVRQQGQWVGELSLISRQGNASPVIENIFLLRDDTGKPLCFATVFTDISERTRMQAELDTYRDHLEHLVAQRTAELEKSNTLLHAHITQREQSESERARLTAILESTSDLVATAAPDGRVLYVNASGRRVVGWETEDDLGRHNLAEVHPAWALRIVREEGIPAAMAHGEWRGETAILKQDGLEIPVSQVIMAHRGAGGEVEYLSTIMRDISARKHNEEALRESEEKFRTIVDNMQDAFFRCDLEGNLVYNSESAARLLGCPSAEDMIGMQVADFYYDPEQEKDRYEMLKAQGRLTHYEVTLKRRDNGRPVVVLANSQFYRDRDGNIIGVEGVYSDITERKQAEEALRKSEAKYRLLHRSMRDAFVSIDLDGRITEFNEVYVEMLGYEPEELKTLTYKDITPEKWHAFEAGIQKEQILKRGYSDIFEKEYRRKDGTVFPIELRAFLLRDEAGEPSGMWAIVRDITERKQAEVALRKSEERYRRIVDTAIEGIWALDADMLTDFVNARLAEMIGYQREEIIGRRFESFLFEEDLADHAQRIKLRKQGVSESYERRLRHRQGYAVMVLISASPILDNAGRFQGSFAMLTDITERKQAEDALRESEQRFRVLAQSMAQLVWITDGEGKSIYQNPQFVDYTGLYECTSRELLACVHPEDRVQVQEEFSDAISSGQGGFQKEFRLRRRDGIYRWFLTRVIIMRDADKRVDRLFGTATDIDDLIRTKQALQDNLELLAQAERIGHIGSWKMDVSTNMLTVSAEMRSMLAYPEQAEITVEALLALVHPDDLAGVMAKWQKTLEIGIPSTLEFRGIHPNGTIHYVEVRAEASFDAQGKPVVIQGYAVDLTEKKRLEDELIKAQKLDSIGTLAGGLAHDYNNLLTAILGNIDLAKMHISQSHKAYHLLMEAQKATMRARDLTLQLITFSKGGYPLGKIMSIHGLLAQSVGLALSGTDTKPQWRMADDLPEVKIDENQIRQVIHNIVINAHEAMPQGGILTIEADKDVLGPDNPLVLAEGVYVRLAFYDQGCGISPENLPKVFDPYFSTKDRGSARGLGLGLSICYSIIKRHGGHIMVNSLVGKGTTVTLYIPAAVVQPGA